MNYLEIIKGSERTRSEFKALLTKTPMTDREKSVVTYRFGLDNGICHTLEETGKLFGVTRERIRQIESKALDRMSRFEQKDLSTGIDKK